MKNFILKTPFLNYLNLYKGLKPSSTAQVRKNANCLSLYKVLKPIKSWRQVICNSLPLCSYMILFSGVASGA